ncbi:hypothetical protein BDL97_02G062600 [Sphagnum fallax]|nr:hypothetical protein BDL97_02G062600 [Sphagnum fallax]KAH8969994.1 hypothetical protein BDL97_02G062600 [Sphagnum fallax]
MVRMGQEWQGSSARRRSLESAMKETQARTKVVLRHLPPSLSSSALHDQIVSKYAGTITWFAFHPGKSSHKRQVYSRAYINFKKVEDVIDFYEVFNGHIFVNEKGTQYKALVEYAPHQRVPKPRSKKDAREGTIMKDSDYLAFLELLEKPVDHLPSAEVQLERKEAEKAAALASGAAKDPVIVTPLMEFVRQRRAARFAPQRAISANTKIAARASNGGSVTYNLSQRRSSDRSRPGTPTHVSESAVANKEVVSHGANPRREEQQRREKEILMYRKKREINEGRDKKSLRDAVVIAASPFRGNVGNSHMDPTKEHIILLKDSSETPAGSDSGAMHGLAGDVEQSGIEGLLLGKGFSLVASPGDTAIASGDAKEASKRDSKKKQVLNSKDNNKQTSTNHSPASAKGTSGSVQLQQVVIASRATAAASAATTSSTSKQSHRRESGKTSPQAGLSVRHRVQVALSQHGGATISIPVDPKGLSQQPLERAGKWPPRPHAIRLASKDQTVSLLLPPSSSSEVESGVSQNNTISGSNHVKEKGSNMAASDGVLSVSVSDRQDARHLRNKDRPDRPVWTPRRRSDTVAVGSEASSGISSAVPSPTAVISAESPLVNSHSEIEAVPKGEEGENGNHRKQGVKSGSNGRGSDSQQSSGVGSGSSMYGKTRYVETGSRSSRLGRGGMTTGAMLTAQDIQVLSQGDLKNETNGKSPGGRQNKEDEDHAVVPPQPSVMEDRRKQDGPYWNEHGGGHRQGSRHERNGQGPREGEVAISGVELASKPLKRGRGPPMLGINEKQVWVAVQKTVTGG